MHNNSLPASATNVETGPYNISLQQPPVVPQYGGPQVMQQFMPTISACCAMEIQVNVFPQPRNALRIFMFNLFSRNCYNNQAFLEMVTMIADLAAIENMAGRMPDIGNGLPTLITNVVETFAAVQVGLYPGLTNYLDQSFQAPVQAQMQQLTNFKNIITNAQRGQQAPQQNAWGVAQQPQWAQGQQQAPGQHWAAAGGYQPPQNRAILGVSSSGLFGHTPEAAPVGAPPPANSKYTRSYGNTGGSTAHAQPVVQEEVMQQPINEVMVSAATDIKWSPSPQQPYPPAYNPRKVDMQLVLDPTTNTVTATFVEKEPTMDYNRHQIPSVFGPLPSHYENAAAVAAQERLSRSLKAAEEEIAERKVDSDRPAVAFHKQLIDIGSLRELWVFGMVRRYRYLNDAALPTIFSYVGEVNQPFISMRDEQPNIKRMSESLTYSELREKLMAMRASVLTAELWTHCERLMTTFINDTLKKKMSMTIDIDSFCNDYPDLVKLIKEDKGEQRLNEFLKDQDEHISRLFKKPRQGAIDHITKLLMEEEEHTAEQMPSISFMSTRYSVTLLNTTSFNMEVEFDERVASGLTKTRTPELHKLATMIFEETDKDKEISHRYIRTTDGRVMELTRGAIGENFFLISLVE